MSPTRPSRAAPAAGAMPAGAANGRLDRLAAAAPWWAVSVLLHVVVLLVLTLVVLVAARPDDETRIITTELEDPPEDPYDPEVPHPMEPEPRELDPDVIVESDPVLEPSVDEPVETPTLDTVMAESASVFDAAPAPTAMIGVGGGPRRPPGGGPFGNRRLGRGEDGGGDTSRVYGCPAGGLQWLARHQSANGSWEARGFHGRCNSDPDFPGLCANDNGGEDVGWEQCDVGVTGLSLLAFLGSGYTHEEGRYKITVKRALKYALDVQHPDGSFGNQIGHEGNYNQACMAMALAEAYGMTAFNRLREPAQRAVDFIARAQNDGLGWRYGLKPGENDSSVTGWMVLALKSAKLSGLFVDEKCFTGALTWFDLVTDPAYGKVGYMTRGGSQSRLGEATHFATNEALTAVAITAQLFLGLSRADATLKHGAALLAENPPAWEPESKIDMYYWYYASMALFQMGKPYWNEWEQPMANTLIRHQRQGTATCVDGSWDPIGPWGGAGGRVYATAINVLTLEVYYRYDFIKANR